MKRPVGFFDSGFGGLSVLKELTRILPNENLIYLGDTANLPYGNKSPQTVMDLALQNGLFLQNLGIKLLVIPCHTACCHAMERLQAKLSIPIIGVVEPALELVKEIDRIAVLATTSTIESRFYQKLIAQQNPKAEIYPTACPLFVPMIEEGFHEHPSMELIARAYLNDLRGKVDGAILACTHYPLIREVIQKILGDVLLIEPASRCALLVKEALEKKHLLNRQTEKPSYQFFATDDAEKFKRLGAIFLGSSIEKVEKIKNLCKS